MVYQGDSLAFWRYVIQTQPSCTRLSGLVEEGLRTYGECQAEEWKPWLVASAKWLRPTTTSRARIGQVEYLGRSLIGAGIAVVKPIGSHGVFLDARAILPHIPQAEFPRPVTGSAALYLGWGIQSMERGVVSAGRDPKTGDHRYPRLELVRLAIPRRVYTQAHMDVVAGSVIAVYDQAESNPRS